MTWVTVPIEINTGVVSAGIETDLFLERGSNLTFHPCWGRN